MAWFRRIISLSWLTALLAFIPFLILVSLVAHHVVDVPYFDQWSLSELSVYYRNGGHDLGGLFAQHNEARRFFPALLNLACEYLFDGDVRTCVIPSFLLAALSLSNIYRLASKTIPQSALARFAVTLLASMMIFSPVQWQNWLWGNQVALYFPAACLTSAIVIAGSELRFRAKLGICAALAFVATFSFPNGILCWVILPTLLLWHPESIQERVRATALWLAASLGSIWLFFHGYGATPRHAAWQDSFDHPLILVLSFMGFLGAPLSSGGEIWLYRSGRIAALGMIVMLAAACLTLLLKRNRTLVVRSAGWLSLCAFVLGSAAVTAITRSTMSSTFLHDSRYTSFSVYLVIGLAGVLAVIATEWSAPRHRMITMLAGGTLCAVVIGLHISASVQSLQEMQRWRTARLQSKACLLLIDVTDSACIETKVGPAYSQVLDTSHALNKLGLLHPPLLNTTQLPANLISSEPLDSAHAKLANLRRLQDGSWIASGLAILPGREEPADGVVITYDDARGERHVAGLATTLTRTSDNQPPSRWTTWFTLPEGATQVRAYAYDAERGAFFFVAPAQGLASLSTYPIQFGIGDGGSLDRLGRGFMDFPDRREPMMAFGWSFLHAQARTPDAILVTCEGEQKIIGSGEAHLPRPDVVRALGNDPRPLYSGFGAIIAQDRLPAGGCQIKTWGYDSISHTALPLGGAMNSRQFDSH